MPDPTYKTFLSPGSCQLEVTDLVASANDDTGVDLYGVAWEIEQVLIAGEGFAASPTDVWVNERGILNVGQSLFDKINRTALNNTNIPGQCTVIVKATSLVDSSKVARLKVLVGYPGEGGGGGGGGTSTQTLTVTKDDASDVLSVATISWADYIAGNEEGIVDIQPDSTEGLTSVYSIPVGAELFANINDSNVLKFLDAEMTITFQGESMPSTPLYAKADSNVLKFLDAEMTIPFQGESMPSTPLYAKAAG